MTIVRDLAAGLSTALAANGLIPRGGFNFGRDESPSDLGPAPARAVVLVGQAGAAAWRHFSQWRRDQPADTENPLDSWSRAVIDRIASKFDARAVYPSDKPYLPFQQWAMRAEGLKPSPLGILMHPEYGLWHAYRGALLFDDKIPIQPPETVIHLCDACAGKPCLKACPVEAYSEAGFAYQGCLSHVRGPSGGRCREAGCLDRNACPYGAAYRYPAEMQAFHMAAFAR